MQALEIGHFRRVTGFDQGFETGADQFDETAAQNDLFAEEVGFALFLEVGFDDARTAAANAAGVGESEFKRIARSVLVNGNEAGNAAALLVFAANRVAGALRCDHDDVERSLRLDEAEVNVEAVCESDRCAITDVAGDIGLIDVSLEFVRRCHHQEVAPLGGFGNGHDLEAVGFGLLDGRRTGLQGDDDVLGAGILEVQRMGAALGAVTDDDDILGLDEIEIGITIIINAHFMVLP
ncbi:hypothetical protein D3C78_1105610 [compost metagenome]